MQRMGLVWIIGLILLFLSAQGGFAAEGLVQIIRPDGVGFTITAIDASQSSSIEAYEIGLWLLTPAFSGTSEAKGLTSTVVTVEGGKVTGVYRTQNGVLPKVPKVPGSGYVLIGSGMADNFLGAFKVGDNVELVSKERLVRINDQTVVVTDTKGVFTISGFNRGRGVDQLIVYTPDFGTHTMTNEWGFEVAVADGVAVAIRGYQDKGLFAIPNNGYVLSGHGSARSWLKKHAQVGKRVELSKGSLPGMRVTEQEMFNALDLDYPGLEGVRQAVVAKDWEAARKAFITYLRKRDTPNWYFNWRDPLGGGSVGAGDITAADDGLRNRFTVIDIPYQFSGEIDWGFNPTTQPGSSYAQNHEWTWQFSRHRFWVSMGRTYHLIKNEAYAKAFAEQMLDWVEKNPPPSWAEQGAFSRWRTIEAGIRMGQTWPNAFLYFLSSPSFTDEAIVTMVRSMLEHARYLSTHQTGGNWLTMEMNGLFHVGMLFPEFKEAADWRRTAAKRMRDELDRQVYPDGAQFELTPGYHNVALDNFLGIVNIAALNNYQLPEGYLERLEAMFDFNLYMMTPSGRLPHFNDSSSGNIAGRLWQGYELFPHRKDFLWAGLNRSLGSLPDHSSYAFPYAGYLVQRSGWDVNARYLAFDVGPFGYGHQHEDKLNFVLAAYGRELVVDGGTYTYDNSKWRTYVRSPYAHNVAFVDGLGQNRRANSKTFVSNQPSDYRSELTAEYEFAQGYYGNNLEGFGSGQLWLATHQRSILYVKEGEGKDFWVVADTFIPQDEESHRYETVFHLDAPDVVVDETSQTVRTTFQRGANLGIFTLLGEKQGPVQVIKGQEEPIVQGWMRIGSREVKAIPTPKFTVEGEGIQHMLYVFYPSPGPDVPDVSVSMWEAGVSRDNGVGAELRFADGRGYRVFFPTDAESAKIVHGKALQGSVYFERLP